MRANSFSTIKYFSLNEIPRLILGLIFDKIFRIKHLIEKKHELDFLLAKGYSFAKTKKSILIHTPQNNSFKIRNNTSDWQVFIQVFKNHEYKPLIEEVIKRKVEPKIVIDAGCNIGLTTIYLNNFFPDATYYCVEPDLENFECLVENIKKNNIKYEPIHAGLTDKECMLEISRNFRDGKNWSFQTVKSKEGSIGISGITLSSIIQKFNIKNIDILKIDIEGAEASVFKSDDIPKILKITRILIIEIHEDIIDKNIILSRLLESGFYYYLTGEHTIAFKKND